MLAAADEQLPDVSGWDGSPFESPHVNAGVGSLAGRYVLLSHWTKNRAKAGTLRPIRLGQTHMGRPSGTESLIRSTQR